VCNEDEIKSDFLIGLDSNFVLKKTNLEVLETKRIDFKIKPEGSPKTFKIHNWEQRFFL
jgi:hypothetical protein